MRSGSVKPTDAGVFSALRGVCVFTGEQAVDNFEKKVRRVQARRWETFAHLLETARFFGPGGAESQRRPGGGRQSVVFSLET